MFHYWWAELDLAHWYIITSLNGELKSRHRSFNSTEFGDTEWWRGFEVCRNSSRTILEDWAVEDRNNDDVEEPGGHEHLDQDGIDVQLVLAAAVPGY